MSDQAKQIASGAGFIAALDQSGGSTPKALGLYGVDASAYGTEEEMFAEVQKMRERIIMSPDFNNKKVIGAILFERTMDEQINGKPVAHYLWEDTGVVPFLKIDKGLEDESEGVQLMKPMPDLGALLTKAKNAGIFGTKERSVVKSANLAGIAKIVAQQFEVAQAVISAGLIPIIEPEVDINAADKAAAEDMLRDMLMTAVASLPKGQQVMLKVTIPEKAGQYDALADHPAVMRVVALSGGYSTDDATARLSQNTKMIASFSRALTEGLQRDMTDAAFDSALGANIDKIYKASV
jgi:fructose-bisphosphate aldolase class I